MSDFVYDPYGNHYIFGSEELSSLAPAVVERVPAPYLALSPDDATRLGIAAGESVEL
jgi:NADH-quinone oxidoreductase subunit G